MNAFEDACEEIGNLMPRTPSREELLESEIRRLRRENLRLIEELNQLKGKRQVIRDMTESAHRLMQKEGPNDPDGV